MSLRPSTAGALGLALLAGACAAQSPQKTPTASPGCDAANVCRVYVTLEKGPGGQDEINVYPDTLFTKTGKKDAHVVWIILNDGVTFSATRNIAIQQGDPTQWTDKYPTDKDDGARPDAGFVAKNFHGRFPVGSKEGVYKYAITVQRGSATPVTKDPAINNSR